MTDADRHDELRDLLPLYVLQQLDEHDQVRVERALAADPDLRRELGDYERTTERLAEGMPRHAAPASIRASVMSSVRASAAHMAGGSIDDIAAAAESARPADELAGRRGRRAGRRSWFTAPAFTGALAAACLNHADVAIDRGRDLDAATDRADRLERDAGGPPAGGAPPGFEDARPYTVTTSSQFEESTGSLVRISDDKWILMINNVPAPEVGKSWQVWTANSSGLIENVAQWHTGDDHLLVLDSPDIVEVMVSYEPTTRPVPTPSDVLVADVKV